MSTSVEEMLKSLEQQDQKQKEMEKKHHQKREEDKQKPIKRICRNYSRGFCKFGKKCKFSHRIVTSHKKLLYQVWMRNWTSGYEPQSRHPVAFFLNRKAAEDHLEYLNQTTNLALEWIDYFYIVTAVIGQTFTRDMRLHELDISKSV